MAGPFYVSSVDGSDADSGADWTNAKATVTGAIALLTAGATTPEFILVDSAHANTVSGAITWTFPAGNFCVLSVNRAGSDALLAGATETVDLNGGVFTVNFNTSGSTVYMYGMTLRSDDGGNANNDINLGNAVSQSSFLTCESCTFVVRGNATSHNIGIGAITGTSARGQDFLFNNCTFTLANNASGTGIQLWHANSVTFNNLTLAYTGGATKPIELMDVNTTGSTSVGTVIFRNSDLSNFDQASSFLVDVANLQRGSILFENCKISTNTTAKTGTFPYGRGQVILRNTSSANDVNAFEVYNRWGTLTEDDTIYADTGAQFSGAAVSWKVVTTAECNEANPFEAPQIAKWNTATTSTNFDIYLNSSVALNDRECWMNVGVEENASFPNYNYYSTRWTDPFRTGESALTSGGTWTGVANNDLKLRLTKTPAEAGLMTANVYIGIASTTVYIDPIIRVS